MASQLIPGLSPEQSAELTDQIRALWSLATPREEIARAVRLPRKLVDRIVNNLAGDDRRPVQLDLFDTQPRRNGVSER